MYEKITPDLDLPATLTDTEYEELTPANKKKYDWKPDRTISAANTLHLHEILIDEAATWQPLPSDPITPDPSPDAPPFEGFGGGSGGGGGATGDYSDPGNSDASSGSDTASVDCSI